ncbi:DnaA N-terminal domain-containing protein [Sporolactobacillus sp. STCC-11]|uniref:DnaA N-terminal domain-containing protein n=1 Tax=Sporolactobacillus caesalpiniae TaxID=3230362 RepID=UPI0033992370
MHVITLSGSKKFKHQFERVNAFLTLQGNIVISLAFFEQSDGFKLTQEQVELLGDLHLKKIDMSDELFVIDVDGYIGSQTRKEIEYAEKNGKRIRYYSSFAKNTDEHRQMELWEQALNLIAGTIKRAQYETWFKDTKAKYDGETFFIDCANDFSKDWLYTHYSPLILKAAEHVTENDKVKIAFRSSKQTSKTIDKSRVTLIKD